MGQTLYDILEVAPSASPETIHAAYRSLISRNHPDKVAGLGSELQALAAARTKEINHAYEVLRDAAKRTTYDAGLRRAKEPSPHPTSASTASDAPKPHPTDAFTVDALPFSSSTEQTDSALRTYLCSQAYLPVDFVSPKNKVSSATLYAPMYVFRASFSANWNASFGFDRQEHYTEYKTELINNVRRTTPVTRTKTVTDWRPANGTARGDAMFAAYAGSNMPAEAIELMEGVYLANVVAMEAGAIRVPVEPFTLSQDHVWSTDIKPRLDGVIDQEVKGHRQGNRQNNWSWNATTKYSVSELLFPMEEIQIRFGDKTYNFWIDGSDISRIKHEDLPRDEAKFRAVLLGFLPAVVIAISSLIWWATVEGSLRLAIFAFIFVTASIAGGFIYKNSIETRSRNALISAAGLDVNQ